MTIRYSLIQNKKIAGAGRCVARVCSADTLEIEGVGERMLQHHSTVSKADILAVLEEFFSTIEKLALEGVNVNTPVAIFRSSVQGVFEGSEDKFDPRRHKVVPRVLPGKRLRRAYRFHARLTKVYPTRQAPNPLLYTDMASGTKNGILTPCRTGRLYGGRLSFDPADPRQGIFFVAAGKTEVRVQEIVWNEPANLAFLVPPLPAGEYELEVRAVFDESGQVRGGHLRARLTVPAECAVEIAGFLPAPTRIPDPTPMQLYPQSGAPAQGEADEMDEGFNRRG